MPIKNEAVLLDTTIWTWDKHPQ